MSTLFAELFIVIFIISKESLVTAAPSQTPNITEILAKLQRIRLSTAKLIDPSYTEPSNPITDTGPALPNVKKKNLAGEAVANPINELTPLVLGQDALVDVKPLVNAKSGPTALVQEQAAHLNLEPLQSASGPFQGTVQDQNTQLNMEPLQSANGQFQEAAQDKNAHLNLEPLQSANEQFPGNYDPIVDQVLDPSIGAESLGQSNNTVDSTNPGEVSILYAYGPETVDQHLNNDPVHGGWSIWSDWSKCDVTCGDGYQRRMRDCVNPVPSNGGMDCYEHFQEIRECVNQPCIGVTINEPKRVIQGQTPQGEIAKALEMHVEQPMDKRSNMMKVNLLLQPDVLQQPEQIKSQVSLNELPSFGQLQLAEQIKQMNGFGANGVQNIPGMATQPMDYMGQPTRASFDQLEKLNGLSQVPDYNPMDPMFNVQQGSPVKVSVDGSWSNWLSWLPCDASCGNGTQLRQRFCDSPAPQYGGAPCPGSEYEYRPCDIPQCPIAGSWSEWSPWGMCDKTCGNGTQRRERLCNNPAPQFGGPSCPGPEYEARFCYLATCPVDGNWGLWTPWDHCDVTCGQGKRLRKRTCDSPAPRYGGAVCQGPEFESQPCTTDLCPVDGGWSKWSKFTHCDVTCGKGRQIRIRKCDSPAPANGGLKCDGRIVEKISCFLKPCPIDGIWGEWTGWSACGVSCGPGTRVRFRKCDQPAPSYGGRPCPGSAEEMEPCNQKACPVDGGWSKWTKWSSCDVTCGAGTQTRSRGCTSPKPANGGKPCIGEGVESKQCMKSSCILDGRWSPWSPWGQCDVTCGDGTQSRTRECNNPAPTVGGLDCVGYKRQMQSCQMNPCPVTIGWAPWGQWGPCSVSCDIGLQKRQRVCNGTYIHIGQAGKQCYGDSSEYRVCMPGACKDGGWSLWSPWSPCSSTCGTGVRTRGRLCNNPEPSALGRYCVGVPSQTETCEVKPCKEVMPSFTVNKPSTIINGKLTFSYTIFNQGGDFSPVNGEFLCTHPGTYYFSLSLVKKRDFIRIDKVFCNLYKNNDTVIYTGIDPTDDDTDKGNAQAHNAAVVHLKYGDVVSLQGCSDPPSYYMEDWSSFTGFMIQPDP